MTKAQRAAIIRVIRFYKDRNRYNGVTSVRIETENYEHFISLTVTTRRSDCEKYSPRQIISEQYAHIFIGKRGGIKVKRARSGINRKESGHVQHMTRSHRWGH